MARDSAMLMFPILSLPVAGVKVAGGANGFALSILATSVIELPVRNPAIKASAFCGDPANST